MKKILVVVDMQNDFITGPLGNEDCRNAVAGCVELCENGGFDEIFFTKDTHYGYYLETLEGQKLPVKHCIKGTNGWKIIPELSRFVSKDYEIEKTTFGSVSTSSGNNLPNAIMSWMYDKRSNFKDFIEPVEIHFCGVCTSICVISNMAILRAHFPNTKIVLHRNATGDVTPEMKEAAFVVAKSIQCEVED